MQIPNIIIAVDGFSSTGKSSFAKLIAREFGMLYLDSGALYRGVTLFAQENGMIDQNDVIDLDALHEALEELDLRFHHTEQGSQTFIGTRNIEKEIRSMAVSSQVSPISAVAFVRNFVDDKLHEMSSSRNVVMDGRDIGTTVFPDAELKIFMTASDQVRAQRRFDEMVAKGDNPVFEDVLNNIRERDYIDSHRETSPLVQSPDAFVIDNSEMTMAEEMAWIRGLIQGVFGIKC